MYPPCTVYELTVHGFSHHYTRMYAATQVFRTTTRAPNAKFSQTVATEVAYGFQRKLFFTNNKE